MSADFLQHVILIIIDTYLFQNPHRYKIRDYLFID